MSKNNVKPFELLAEYERLSLKHKVDVLTEKVRDQWSGVGFKVGDTYYAIAIEKIVEVLILSETTKIPGIAKWVLGLGNIRGNLLPIIDFKSYLTNQPIKITAHTRMVVIQQIAGQVGLVVDEVFGQKHFVNKQKIKNNKKENELKYSELAFEDKGIVWNVLEDEKLINDPLFQNAAAV